MNEEKRTYDAKWQPLVLMLRVGDRLECKCGSLATIIVGSLPSDPEHYYNTLEDVDVWCQSCFVKAQDEAKKEPLQGEFETLSKDGVRATLQATASEYADRAEATALRAKEAVDCQSASDSMIAAARWEARRDTVMGVAEKLGIELGAQEE